MKTLKSALVMILLISFATEARAQEYTHQLSNDPSATIEIAISRSDITIEGHDGDEIVIRNLDYEPPPERAEGLRSLYNSAKDNTGIGFSVEEEGNTVKIIQASNDDADLRLRVPNRVRIMMEQVNWRNGDIEIRNHAGEIEIKSNNGDMKLIGITGPVIASSTSGDIEIDFDRLAQSTPTSISLVSGFIDISVPANTSADFILSSISGEIYTNLDIDVEGEESNMRRLGGSKKVAGSLNGGGVEVGLKTISGNIYLRKKE